MEQSETVSGTVASPAAAPVVRQLDFTVNLKFALNANAIILPDHPQARLQYKLIALAKSRQVAAPARSQSPSRTAAQTKLPSRKMVMPPKSLQPELSQEVGPTIPAAAPRLGHLENKTPVPKPPLQPLLKLESPKSREKGNLERNDCTPKRQKQCSCKNSRCLKLYCECFASGVYCVGCNCIKCHNKMEHEAARTASIEIILERNPNAFRPKIANSPHGNADGGVEHNKGCHCKKSGCLKRYCECFQANILCSDKCKCMDCKNYEGSEEREAHFRHYPANSIALMQQAVNAAINGAIGTPNKKSRTQQIAFGLVGNKQLCSWPPQYPQESCLTSDASNSSLSHHPSKSILGLSKSSYRSSLDGILLFQHVEDFCTLLIELSAEATQNFLKENKASNASDVIELESGRASSSHDDRTDHQNQENGESNGFDIHNERPCSLATLAVMCDKQDATFMAEKAPSSITENKPDMDMKSVSPNGFDQLYIDQERLVLTRFHDFLVRIITCGSIEEAKIDHGTSKTCGARYL